MAGAVQACAGGARLTPGGWLTSRYLVAAKLRKEGLIPKGPSGYVPDRDALVRLKALTAEADPELDEAARLAGETPWPSGNPGVLGLPYTHAALLLDRDDLLPDGLPKYGFILYDHPVTGDLLPRPVCLTSFGAKALPRGPQDAVLDVLEPFLAEVPGKLANKARRDTRSLLRDPALLDREATPDPDLLDRYKTALAAAPPLNPAKPEPWRRAVQRAWPVALGLPLTIPAMAAALRAKGEALGVSRANCAAGCRILRARPLRPGDHGAVARWIEGLNELHTPDAWTRNAKVGWGKARQASVATRDRSRRRGCGRLTGGNEGGRRRRCGTHGCGHLDCGPRQAALAREQSWPYAQAWEDSGVQHVRVGLTVPRTGWTPIEILDALDRCAAGVVRGLAGRLGCRLAGRIAVERQADGTPEWMLLLADVDGELIRRLTAEAQTYVASNQHDAPSVTESLLLALTMAATKAGIATQDLWPELTGRVQHAADAAAKKACIDWQVTYLAPVYDLKGTWADVHKSAQATGYDWPMSFRRFRSSRGTDDGPVLPYADAWTKAGKAPSTRQEAFQQRREAEDQTDATERARTLAEAPGIPLGQSPARRAADDARAAADRAKANLAASRLAVGQAEQLAAQAERNAVAAEAAAQAAERVAATAKKAVKAARRAADVARCRAARARAHVGSLVRAHAIEAAEVRAQEAEAEARTQATSLQAAEDAADRAEQAATVAEARRWFTAVLASKTARAAEHAEIAPALAEITADRAERRARRLEQIAQDTRNKAALAARRARADALLDGPLPAGRPTPLTCRWSPARPPPRDDEAGDDETPITNPWTLTDYVSWLRRVGPPGLRILGRVGIDGEIAAFTIELPTPRSDINSLRPKVTVTSYEIESRANERREWRRSHRIPVSPTQLSEPPPLDPPTKTARIYLDFTGIRFREDPVRRMKQGRARLRATRRVNPHRPAGLPPDLAPWRDPAWEDPPSDVPLSDEWIKEILRRYVVCGIRRAEAGARSWSQPLATADEWRDAGFWLEDPDGYEGVTRAWREAEEWAEEQAALEEYAEQRLEKEFEAWLAAREEAA